MRGLFQTVMGWTMAVLIMQMPSTGWAKDSSRADRKRNTTITTPSNVRQQPKENHRQCETGPKTGPGGDQDQLLTG